MSDEEAVAAADKEMEERANRAKELLSRRYVGLKRHQVSLCLSRLWCWIQKALTFFFSHGIHSNFVYYRKPNRTVKCSWNVRW